MSMGPFVHLKRDVNKMIEQLDMMRNPVQRAREALKAADWLRLDAMKRIAAVRQKAVSELHDEGWSLQDIASELGISRARAQQLTSGITPLMRKKWREEAERV